MQHLDPRARLHLKKEEVIVGRPGAALVALLTAVIGLDFALVWGLLAFLLNFIPTIGSLLAAVPAVLLTVVQIDITSAIIVSFG